MLGGCCGGHRSFRFSERNHALNDAVAKEFRRIEALYRRAKQQLSAYGRKRRGRRRCVRVIASCLALYDASERLTNALLTEILRPKACIRQKRAVFELLDRMVRIFYCFDRRRLKRVLAFHDFAVLRQGAPGLSARDELRMASFASLAMPMAHLFVSSFRSNNLELHVPRMLFRRNVLHLDRERRAALHLACRALCATEMRHAAMFFCAAYNRFFWSGDFRRLVDGLSERERPYYDAMLLL